MRTQIVRLSRLASICGVAVAAFLMLGALAAVAQESGVGGDPPSELPKPLVVAPSLPTFDNVRLSRQPSPWTYFEALTIGMWMGIVVEFLIRLAGARLLAARRTDRSGALTVALWPSVIHCLAWLILVIGAASIVVRLPTLEGVGSASVIIGAIATGILLRRPRGPWQAIALVVGAGATLVVTIASAALTIVGAFLLVAFVFFHFLAAGRTFDQLFLSVVGALPGYWAIPLGLIAVFISFRASSMRRD